MFPRQIYYIQSKPPANYLYHSSGYAGLKGIAQSWAIRAPMGKQTVSLSTDPGRFMSPMPIFSMITVDGVVRIPYNEEMRALTVPALYRTYNSQRVEEARKKGYTVYSEDAVPPEYKHIMKFVVHNDMFVNENEYTVIAPHVNLPVDSAVFVNPAKLKRLKASLGAYSMDVKSLGELAEDLERGIR